MNKKNILLTVLFAISAMPALPVEPEQSPKGLSTLCKSYATSLISGGLIGTATGLLSIQAIFRSIDCAEGSKNDAAGVVFALMVPTIILIAENRLRTTLTNDINQNLQENAINHNKNLLYDTAWIASWISFLSCIKFK